MGRPTHFEIHCNDVDRAAKFYHDVFGWDIQKWDGPMEYWMVMTGAEGTPGINGGMMKRLDPAGSVYNSIEVDNIESAIERVNSLGGKQVVDKMAVPGMGWLAYCQDTEGGVFGIFQIDENVK